MLPCYPRIRSASAAWYRDRRNREPAACEAAPAPRLATASHASKTWGRQPPCGRRLDTVNATSMVEPKGHHMTMANSRSADHPIAPIFLERWSPRAFNEQVISDHALLTLLEAARWAPSSYNSQPWRFLYSKRGSDSWPKFLGLLSERNQSWAKNAAALLIVVSKQTLVPPGQQQPIVSRTHSFDTGAAWAYLALQASLAGWHAHAMAGFDFDRARTALNVPDDYRVEAAIAIGKLGDKSSLPEPLQALENPNGRRPLSETVLDGGFPPPP